MIQILFNSFKAATRHSVWDAPEYWLQQHQDCRDRSHHADVGRAQLHSALRRTGLR